MKWGFLFLIILFISSCQSLNRIERFPSSIKGPEERHIVFDIDWTVVANYEPEFSKVIKSEVITIGEESYVVNDGLRELVEYLLERGIKVSFFSGGDKVRNEALLKKIRLKNGKSLFEIANAIKSKNDLTAISGLSDQARFSEKFKKDLTKITGNLENVILIEDNPNFYLNEEQKRNLLWLGKTYKHFDQYLDVKKAKQLANVKDLEYIPSTFDEWLVARKKFVLVKKNIEEALEVERETGISFVESVRRVYEKMRYDKPDSQIYWAEYLRFISMPTDNNAISCQKMLIQFSKN